MNRSIAALLTATLVAFPMHGFAASAPVVVQSANGTTPSGGAQSISVTLNAQPAVGDLLVAFVSNNDRGTNAGPNSSWVKYDYDPTSRNCSYTALYHVVTPQDGATYVFTGTSASGLATALLYEISGANATSPIDARGYDTVGKAAKRAMTPSLTPTQTGDLPLSFLGVCGASTITNPPQWTVDQLVASLNCQGAHAPAATLSPVQEIAKLSSEPGETGHAALTLIAPSATINPPSDLTYSANPLNATVGVAITTDVPSSGGGAPTLYTVYPSLPEGLGLSASSGTISGTPSTPTAQAYYTITASNVAGSTTAVLSVTVSASTSSGGVTYYGCLVYGGDTQVIGRNIANAPVASYSTSAIANMPSGDLGQQGDETNDEVINVVNNLTPLVPVAPDADWPNPLVMNGVIQPQPQSIPWTSASKIELPGTSEGHTININTNTCIDDETGGTESWNGSGPLYIYNGFILNQNDSYLSNFPQPWPLGGGVYTAATMPFLGFADVGEDASGPIQHPFMFSMKNGQNLSIYGHYYPANSPVEGGPSTCSSTMNCVHYGDLFRLKASFNCSAYAVPARYVCIQLQQYGMYLADTGGGYGYRMGPGALSSDPWTGVETMFNNMPIGGSNSVFDIVQPLGSLICTGSPCY